MSVSGTPLAAEVIATPARAHGAPAVFLEFTKARLSGMVVLTAAVGFWLGSPSDTDWLGLIVTLLGTTLAAWGANALNQCLEWRRDARMLRTRNRPLPSGKLSPRSAWFIALLLATAGPLVLLFGTNSLTAALSAICVLLYVLVYTPMKIRTPHNTLVGAVVGGIPPLMGWTAATGQIGVAGIALGAILFVWQIPHFLALAWMYREDYARGGYHMLPLHDTGGALTVRVVLMYCMFLIPTSLVLTLTGATGQIYAGAALLLGIGFLLLALRLYRERSISSARRLFLASVIYLPLLLAAMSLDRGPLSRAFVREVAAAPAQPTPMLAASETRP